MELEFRERVVHVCMGAESVWVRGVVRVRVSVRVRVRVRVRLGLGLGLGWHTWRAALAPAEESPRV